MKNIYPAKSSFHKLYLIEEEMYNRVLPKLNEVEKQELGDLQEAYKPYEDSEEVTPKENDSALSKPETIVEQMEPERINIYSAIIEVEAITFQPGSTKSYLRLFI